METITISAAEWQRLTTAFNQSNAATQIDLITALQRRCEIDGFWNIHSGLALWDGMAVSTAINKYPDTAKEILDAR